MGGMLGNQGEKTFKIEGRIIGLRDMEIVKSLLEECTQYLIFFHEKSGISHNDQFHAFYFW